MIEDFYQRPVAEGVCLYDGSIEYPVFIVEQNYDYFHSMMAEDDMLEEGGLPRLNEEGRVFYLFFGPLPAEPPYGVSAIGGAFMSAEEAKTWARENVSYFVRWL